MGETIRFNATLGVNNAPAATEAWEYIKNGQPVPDDPPKYLRTMVGDYIGAGNYWSVNQSIFVPVGYHKEGANFVPDSGGGGIIPPTLEYEIPWGNIVPIKTSAFICETILAIKFTVPANATYGAVAGFTVASEWASPITFRQMTLSATPGDFRPWDAIGANGPMAVANGSTVTVGFNVGGPQGGILGDAPLIPGQSYYANIRNWSVDTGHAVCSPGQLTNMIIQFNWPK